MKNKYKKIIKEKHKIAVSGASKIDHCNKNIKELSMAVGEEIARQNCILITGATTGAPLFRLNLVRKREGLVLGFLRQRQKRRIVKFTGFLWVILM